MKVHGQTMADLMVIAPLSCNSAAKMAHGFCDNLLMATYLSATCPVAVAPAMDEDMWLHPSTKENLRKLSSYGHSVIPVEKGELASGVFGEGRMAEPEAIYAFVEGFFSTRKLEGKKALVTAGPTHEPIDAVRFIGNHSSGRMGIEIATELQKHGAEVALVMGPSQLAFTSNGFKLVKVATAEEMYEACNELFTKSDITVMAAAVADYTPVEKHEKKIKKTKDRIQVELKKTKDILKSLGEKKRKDQVLVGFALETEDEKSNALKKLKEKHADLIVLNSLKDEGAGFGHETNKITIFDKKKNEYTFDTKPKKEVAKDIVDTIIRLYYA
jgi:phosphopantothenoylcysteine decarboxylase/phosphopantothenate--cysteine ligase